MKAGFGSARIWDKRLISRKLACNSMTLYGREQSFECEQPQPPTFPITRSQRFNVHCMRQRRISVKKNANLDREVSVFKAEGGDD